MRRIATIFIFVTIGLIKLNAQTYKLNALSLDNPDLRILYYGAWNGT